MLKRKIMSGRSVIESDEMVISDLKATLRRSESARARRTHANDNEIGRVRACFSEKQMLKTELIADIEAGRERLAELVRAIEAQSSAVNDLKRDIREENTETTDHVAKLSERLRDLRNKEQTLAVKNANIEKEIERQKSRLDDCLAKEAEGSASLANVRRRVEHMKDRRRDKQQEYVRLASLLGSAKKRRESRRSKQMLRKTSTTACKIRRDDLDAKNLETESLIWREK